MDALVELVGGERGYVAALQRGLVRVGVAFSVDSCVSMS